METVAKLASVYCLLFLKIMKDYLFGKYSKIIYETLEVQVMMYGVSWKYRNYEVKFIKTL